MLYNIQQLIILQFQPSIHIAPFNLIFYNFIYPLLILYYTTCNIYSLTLLSLTYFPDYVAWGGGGSNWTTLSWTFIMAKRPGQSGWNFLTFPVYLLTKDLSKKNGIFLGGYPPSAPQMGRPTKKRPPITAYDPIF